MDGEEWARQDIMEYERANQMLIRTNTAKAVSLSSRSLGSSIRIGLITIFPRIVTTHALPR